MQKNKANSTTTDTSSYLITVSQIFFVAYLFVGFLPNFGAVDYDAPEWLYISLVNVAALFFIYKNNTFFKAFEWQSNLKTFLILFVTFIGIGFLSIINAVNVSESLVHLSRLVNCFVAFYCLVIMIRKNPTVFFHFLCKVAIITTAYFSLKAVYYFIGNYNSPRTHGFLKAFPHNYASINIYAAYLVVQFPFVIYSFLYFKKIWKYIAGVVMFMAVMALFFASARTALLSLAIILTLFALYILYSIAKYKQPLKRELLFLCLLPIFSGLFVLNINRIDKSSMNSLSDLFVSREADFYEGKEAVKDGNVKQLVPNEIAVEFDGSSTSERFSLWNLAFVRFKEHPILGIGYGNYKATSKKEHYENYAHRQGLFANPRRAHNDFLEKLAETGIIGALLYVSLFIFPLWLFIKLYRKEKDFEKRLLLVTIFGAAIAYTLDALLNFPLERPPVQLYFILIVVFIILLSQESTLNTEKTTTSKLKPILFMVMFLVSFGTVASNYLVFKSHQQELAIRNDFKGTAMFEAKSNQNYTLQSLQKEWINYPELTYVGSVRNVYLANYAIKEKKFDKAIEILQKVKTKNADAFIVKQTLANIYLNVYENTDSVKYYATQVFKDYPAFKTNANALRAAYLKDNDTINAFKVMDRYSKYSPRDTEAWKTKANIIYDVTKDSKRMLAILDTALAYNAYSNTLLLAKQEVLDKIKFKSHLSDAEVKVKHQNAYDFFAKQQYPDARKVYLNILKTNPNDYLSVQNIGIINLIEKKYEAAIVNLTRVIDANVFPDGKAEYSRGYCYEQLGQMKKAKADYTKSRAKKYPQAMSLPKTKYN